jgi:hypothetical protein
MIVFWAFMGVAATPHRSSRETRWFSYHGPDAITAMLIWDRLVHVWAEDYHYALLHRYPQQSLYPIWIDLFEFIYLHKHLRIVLLYESDYDNNL